MKVPVPRHADLVVWVAGVNAAALSITALGIHAALLSCVASVTCCCCVVMVSNIINANEELIAV